MYIYLVTGADTNAINIAALWQTAVIANMASLQSNQLSHNVLEVTCFEDLADWINDFTVTPGSVSGDCLPPYDSFSLFWQRSTRESHNGFKRIPGVPESVQTNGVLTGGALTAMQGLASILQGPIISSSPALSMVPQIWRRPRLSPPRAQAFFAVQSIEAEGQITTQNTRKFGRGV